MGSCAGVAVDAVLHVLGSCGWCVLAKACEACALTVTHRPLLAHPFVRLHPTACLPVRLTG